MGEEGTWGGWCGWGWVVWVGVERVVCGVWQGEQPYGPLNGPGGVRHGAIRVYGQSSGVALLMYIAESVPLDTLYGQSPGVALQV